LIHSWPHQLLHLGILTSTLMGAAALALLVLWDSIFDTPLPRGTKLVALVAVALAAGLYLVEWRIVHQR
jgi:hypothetical protein